MKAVYGGITFAEGYKKSFADFKTEFASTHVFRNIPEHEREAELEKAYDISTDRGKNLAPKSKAVDTEKK